MLLVHCHHNRFKLLCIYSWFFGIFFIQFCDFFAILMWFHRNSVKKKQIINQRGVKKKNKSKQFVFFSSSKKILLLCSLRHKYTHINWRNVNWFRKKKRNLNGWFTRSIVNHLRTIRIFHSYGWNRIPLFWNVRSVAFHPTTYRIELRLNAFFALAGT